MKTVAIFTLLAVLAVVISYQAQPSELADELNCP